MKELIDQPATLRRRLSRSIGSRATVYLSTTCVSTLLFGAVPASALNLYNGQNYGNNVEINLTTTLSYTGLYRVNNPSRILLGDDSDSNFKHGIVGNLFEAVPVLDIRDGNYGAHFSGQFYLNTSYLAPNQNSLPGYANAIYAPRHNDFTSATRNVEGLNGQVLDAFVFGQHNFSDGQYISLKVGRQVLFWGQSLFFAADGISGGQAPINLVTAQNEINPQAQQVFMPVGQAVVTYDPVPGTTIQAYYQFEWEHNYYQAEGAYFNFGDFLDKGASFLPFAPQFGLLRTKDINPEHQNGQFGLSLQQEVGSWDLGIYGERFDAKSPSLGVAPYSRSSLIPGGHGAVSIGTYDAVYGRDIWLEGASFSTNVGPTNVAGEISFREHQPLVGITNTAFFILPGQNANSNPGYPVGNTWDAQLSTIYLTPGLPLDPGGVSILGEVIFNHLINVTQNRSQLRTDGQATAGAFDFALTPTYDDVLPNLQITFPIGLEYNFLGRSDVDNTLYHGTGTFNVGVTGTYKVNWIASLAYQDYLGKPDAVYNALADRGFVSLNLQHTF